MQRFTLRHSFPYPRAAVWAELFSEPYQLASGVDDKLTREIIEERELAGERRRRIRITHKDEMPAFLQRWTGRHLRYVIVQKGRTDETAFDWHVEPAAMANKITVKGRYAIEDAPGGCERVVNAVIRADIFGVGGKIEQGIARDLRKSYEDSARFAATWLKERLA
jgi:hypothetical protein